MSLGNFQSDEDCDFAEDFVLDSDVEIMSSSFKEEWLAIRRSLPEGENLRRNRITEFWDYEGRKSS
jgi:hypothetical protein